MLIPYIIIAVLLIVLVWVIFGNIKLTTENIELAEKAADRDEFMRIALKAEHCRSESQKAVTEPWEIDEDEEIKEFTVLRWASGCRVAARVFSYDDGDREYARLLAEELCDKLNEGL